jgi:hypothetical protein
VLLGAHSARFRRKRRNCAVCVPASGAPVPFKVSECTDYCDKRIPSKQDMEEIAWIIRTKDINRPMGFASKCEDSEAKDGDVEVVPAS